MLKSKHVHIGSRIFIVKSDEEGPRLVYERVSTNVGHPFLEKIVDKSYWHRNRQGASRGLIKRILEKWKENSPEPNR